MATENFHRLIMGKVEIGIYLCVTTDILVKITEFDWLPRLKLCINIHDISLYINYNFIVVVLVLSLLWQLKVSIYMYLKWEKWEMAFVSVLLQIF